jgi:hypothetical protein
MSRVVMAAAAVALAIARPDAQGVRDYVVARVGDEAIFATDVRAAIGLGIVELGTHADPEEAALQALIERRLMLREILRSTPPEPGAQAIEAEVARMKSYAAGTLKTVMSANGVDEERLRRFARDTLRVQLYLDTRFPRLDVSDDEAKQYFQGHEDAFRRNGELMTFEQAAAAAHELATQDRRDARIQQWLMGLKKRTDVTRPAQPAAPPR